LFVGDHVVTSIDDEGHLAADTDSNKKKKHWSKQKKIMVIAGSACALLIITLFLTILLNRKKDVEIPDLSNSDRETAVNELQAKNLKISPKIEKISDDNIAAGKIIKTNPPARTKVKEGSLVKLFVSTGLPAFKIGDYVSKTYVEAKDEIERKGLKVKTNRMYSDTVKEGEVIKQSISPGSKVTKGSTIVITVSKGVEPVTMPNLIGLTMEEAASFASENDLNIIEDTPQFSDSFPNRTVISQSPNFGTKLKKGDDFHVTYSKGSKPRMHLPKDDPGFVLSNLIGENRINLIIYARNHGLKIVEESAQYSDDYEKGQVIDQYPEAGTMVKSGDQIRVTYSLGSEPQPSDNQPSSSDFSSSSDDVVK
jgi:eukaryotic-like serine/threonine-protein kinase